MQNKKSTLLHNGIVTVLTMKPYSILILAPEEIPEPGPTSLGENLYFEVLELQPIKLSISFMRTERVSSDEQSVFCLISSISAHEVGQAQHQQSLRRSSERDHYGSRKY